MALLVSPLNFNSIFWTDSQRSQFKRLERFALIPISLPKKNKSQIFIELAPKCVTSGGLISAALRVSNTETSQRW